jgi:hypothetical protein
MSDINQHITIAKDVASGDDLDYAFLREKGLQYIEELAGKVWTDYNEHDPGITILEMLCYAISDLGARMALPIEDILTPANGQSAIQDQFFSALQILPSKPVSEADYRKLFIDIKGVKNCWLKKYEKTVHVDCKNDLLSYKLNDFEAIGKHRISSFILNGLYEIVVDFDEPDDVEFPNDDDKSAEIERIKKVIADVYHQNRNLCEDLIKVSEVETHSIEVCASIELEPETDEEMVHAKVLRAIDNYFSPDLWFYSLQQMFDKGYTSDQIFEGPTLTNGFIDPKELESADLRTEVRLSDLMQLVMKIDGVKLIREMTINDCLDRDNENDAWLICVKTGRKPKRCEQSAFSYYKGVLPVNVNSKNVKIYQEQLEVEELEQQEFAKVGMEIKVPKGDYLNIGNTTTIQNDFPETYGIGQLGLPTRASVQRKAQAKQLKAYLLFFDQIFATYFSHLDKVKDILSVDNKLAATYFTQAVKDLKGFNELVNDYPEDDVELTQKLLADLDDNITRKNILLDHLLARFAEKFSEYSFLMKELYGEYADKSVIKAKEVFLSEYGELSDDDGMLTNKGISNWRGSAFNYFEQQAEDLWDTKNVAGAQKRIARLCGVKDFSRRNLSESFVEIYDLINSGGEEVYRWHIKNTTGSYILSATDDYKTPRLAEDELYEAIVKIVETEPETILKAFENEVIDETEIGNFEIQLSESGKYSFNIINTNADPRSVDRIIARQFLYYETQDELMAAMLEIIRFFTEDFAEEGMFVVEHILLRPDVTSETGMKDQFMSVCTENCESCEPIDPYSYRVTVVLPGWTYRFSNMDFRKFMEELIRTELPAHVLARICWIGDRKNKAAEENDMTRFEEAYKAFLLAKTNAGQTQDEEKLKKLIESLNQLNTIYPTGRLIDCDDEEDSLEGRIILGRTNIGNL